MPVADDKGAEKSGREGATTPADVEHVPAGIRLRHDDAAVTREPFQGLALERSSIVQLGEPVALVAKPLFAQVHEQLPALGGGSARVIASLESYELRFGECDGSVR